MQGTAIEGYDRGSFPAINRSIAATRNFIDTLDENERAILEQGDALLGVNRTNAVYATQVYLQPTQLLSSKTPWRH